MIKYIIGILVVVSLVVVSFFVGQKNVPKKIDEVKAKVEEKINTSKTSITIKGQVVQGHDQCYRTYYILKTADDKEYRLALDKNINWLDFHKHTIRRDEQRILEIEGYKGEYNGYDLIFVTGFKVTDEFVSHPEVIDLLYTGEHLEKLRNNFKVKIFDDKLKNVLTVGNKDYETVGIAVSKNRMSFSGTKMGVYPPKIEFVTSVNVDQSDFDILLKYSEDIQKTHDKIK
jgi:hypothetical protein